MYHRQPNPIVVFIVIIGSILLITLTSGALGVVLASLTMLVK